MCCTLRKSRRFLSLASFGKQRPVMAKAALSALLLWHRHREALATPTATGGDDLATRRAGHACTESVLVQALAIARLISALHWVLLAMARRVAGASTCVVALQVGSAGYPPDCSSPRRRLSSPKKTPSMVAWRAADLAMAPINVSRHLIPFLPGHNLLILLTLLVQDRNLPVLGETSIYERSFFLRVFVYRSPVVEWCRGPPRPVTS